MKILYSIQGTGNGHVSRAREIVPLLQRHGQLDILISGTQADVTLPVEVKYKFHGFSFIFGKKGGVAHFETWKQMNLARFRKDMKRIPLEEYNLIINDFEPLTAWACKLKGINSVGFSHQAAFRSKHVPVPKSYDWGKLILNHYAPSSSYVGLHFDRYDEHIYTPVIRSEIRQQQLSNEGHYTVYLPALDDVKIYSLLQELPEVEWQVFSKHCHEPHRMGNVYFTKINNEAFNKSLASCAGFFTGGGFEGPAEALYMGKKLLVMPMNYQYEQQCNAYALELKGIPVIWKGTGNKVKKLKKWVQEEQGTRFNFSDDTAAIVDMIVKKYAR